MFRWFSRLWHRLFLDERPSVSLSVFRMVIAFTTWAHVFPSLVHLKDNYFPGAFKTYNMNFFPAGTVEWVQKSPEGLIVVLAVLFCVTSFTMFIGFLSRISCIAMTLCCYYFYALNSFHVGTLSWDILLVQLFLMCLTPYAGDYFSVDALLRQDARGYRRARPYFIQRLLQLNVAFTFFYTGLYKITAQGNWLTDNPLFYVLNYPPQGVTKAFLVRDFLVDKPGLVYGIGVTIVVIELLMPVLLFARKTRVCGIYLGSIFCATLILTLDVPATFFFLFPAQLLLFVNPKHIVRGIELKRRRHAGRPRGHVLFDGGCGFCAACVRYLKVADLFETVEFVDFHGIADLQSCHASLTPEDVRTQMQLITEDGQRFSGFYAFRRLAWWCPMLWPLLLIFYLPFMGAIGSWAYRWIARHRSSLSCKVK